MEARRVPERYVRAIRDMYCWSTTCVRTIVGDKKPFAVEFGLHQLLSLIHKIFSLIMDDITCEILGRVPRYMFFIDDIVLVAVWF